MTGPAIAAPPGRAGRLWVDRRLRAARRGAELLDSKLRLLLAELDACAKAREATRLEWEHSAAIAAQWLLRASLLGGQRSIRLAAREGSAQVHISYTVTAGLRRPASGSCVMPAPAACAGLAAGEAVRAHRAALTAAVAHAAADAAYRMIRQEAELTRYRLHAIRDRWIPRLEQARAEIVFALEELEREDLARLRRAVRPTGT
jgi:V/A-type H+/Na+-transporting ATPase subunit D